MVINLTTYGSSPIETVPHPRLYSQDQDRCADSLFGHLETWTRCRNARQGCSRVVEYRL